MQRAQAGSKMHTVHSVALKATYNTVRLPQLYSRANLVRKANFKKRKQSDWKTWKYAIREENREESNHPVRANLKEGDIPELL